MKEKIEWHTREIDRITRKMEGHEWTRKDYDKRNKT